MMEARQVHNNNPILINTDKIVFCEFFFDNNNQREVINICFDEGTELRIPYSGEYWLKLRDLNEKSKV